MGYTHETLSCNLKCCLVVLYKNKRLDRIYDQYILDNITKSKIDKLIKSQEDSNFDVQSLNLEI